MAGIQLRSLMVGLLASALLVWGNPAKSSENNENDSGDGFLEEGARGILPIKVRYLTYYPSPQTAQELKRDNVEKLIVQAQTRAQMIGYPSSKNVTTLNSLAPMEIEIFMEGSYPSASNVKDINRLEEHIVPSLRIDKCLSSESERARLMGFNRGIGVTILCPTQDQYERAQRLADEIQSKKPFIKIEVRSVHFSCYE